jgi:ABC-type phosphate/phosphonate transport system substrate-binding protein
VTGPVVRVGAVAYDRKVVDIWEAMRDYFREAGVPTDYVLYSNYEAQVEALFRGDIEVAWNTNLAFARCDERLEGRARALAMRDTDLGFTTRLLARPGSGIAGFADLRGRTLALGSADSVQAAIMPLHFLREAGLEPGRDLELLRFDIDVGKHGDTGTSELDVLKALHDGRANAGAVGHATWVRELEAGHVNTALVESVWTSPGYSHCNFTALPGLDPDLAGRWTAALLAMSYDDPRWRRLMDLEGLRAWIPGDRSGYDLVFAALAAR